MPARTARQLARRRQRERLTGGLLAVLGVVVLAVAFYALRQPSDDTTRAGTATPPSTTAKRNPGTSPVARNTTTAVPPTNSRSSAGTVAGRPPLIVLNNTTIPGLAKRAQQTFETGGWTVSDVGNLQNDIVSTCAYYDPAVPGAEQAAAALMQQFPAIKRTAAKFDGLPAGPIVVVLTPDYVSG